MFAAPRPKPSVGTPAGRVQDQDQDQEDEQEIVRSPSQPILVRLEKKLDELLAMVTKKNDIIEDLLQRNREKEAIIDKLVHMLKNLTK